MGTSRCGVTLDVSEPFTLIAVTVTVTVTVTDGEGAVCQGNMIREEMEQERGNDLRS